MELERLEIEDIENMAKMFAYELEDDEKLDRNGIIGAVAVFRSLLKDCLFDNTERLEQARLEGEVDEWK